MLIRGADWFLAQGRIEEAVAHRLSAGDDAGALELLRRQGRWFLDHGAMAALLRFGERAAAGGADPYVCLSLSFAAGLSGQPDRCLQWLQAAEPLIEPDSEPFPGWRSLRAAADSMWSAYGAGGDPDAALRYARRAAELEDDPALWGYVVARQGLADALLGAGSARGQRSRCCGTAGSRRHGKNCRWCCRCSAPASTRWC